MSDNCALHRDRYSPEQFLHQNLGRKYGEIVADAGILLQRILTKKPNLLIDFQDVDYNYDQLDTSGNQGTDCRTADSHFRHSEFTENQAVVDPDIYDKRNAGNDKCNPHGVCAAQRGEQCLRHQKQNKRVFQNGHISHTFCSDVCICRKNCHQL